jgi:hypothetical protein
LTSWNWGFVFLGKCEEQGVMTLTFGVKGLQVQSKADLKLAEMMRKI